MATEPPGFGPSEHLVAMLRACSRDPTEEIKTRLRCMLDTFLQHHRDNAGNENTNELAKKCCCNAQELYYRFLETLAIQERERKGISDISGILGNGLFQSCLVACCLEITISTNRLPCDFPLLLLILKLAPYHFLKVIELVLRAEGDLSRPVFRHLAQVEEKILESLAWTSHSPLWEDIRANEGHLPTCQQAIPPTELEDPKQTVFQPDRNQPVDFSLGAKPSTSTEQQRSPSAVNRSRRSNSLHFFAVKIYKLMGKRLKDLCSTLVYCDELRLKIWTCFEYSLVHCTELMVDRHLDQLLICAIFHTTKISTLDTLSKRIMNCYKSQPLASKSVCKDVLISGGDAENPLTGKNSRSTCALPTDSALSAPSGEVQRSQSTKNNGDHSISILTPNTPSTHYPGPRQEERGDFFDFYIKVYETKMQHFALQFGGDTPPLSPYPRQRKVSPRRQLLSNSYKLPLDRDEEERGEGEEDEDGPPARRLRSDGQSALQRRLGDVINDRVRSRDQDQPSPVIRPNL
uniref:retinoblastoma-like protein 2 isoform X1 n=1 Tax=Epinephelus lanceolatus TaxID=310571 RepID=UPI001446BB5C|nr:retinoblastoma-like protein 2 isoform X1 [Epinephelus lanceolatus]